MRQSEVARKIDVTPQQLSDWIHGRKKPIVEDFIKLCEELEIVSEFFPDYQKKSPELKKIDVETRLNRLESAFSQANIPFKKS